MKVTVLSRPIGMTKQEDGGDCILIEHENRLYMYDCGNERHVDTILAFMKVCNYDKIESLIISHNDSDHTRGIPLLMDRVHINSIYVHMILKDGILDDILDALDDNRRNRESTKKRILDSYDNIADIINKAIYKGIEVRQCIRDNYSKQIIVNNCIKIIAPSREYMVESVASELRSETISDESPFNAASCSVMLIDHGYKYILTGDSSFDNIKSAIISLRPNVIQLAHHGTYETAIDIINSCYLLDIRAKYFASDNTCKDKNGGCDKILEQYGSTIYNTQDNDLVICENNITNIRIEQVLKEIGSKLGGRGTAGYENNNFTR